MTFKWECEHCGKLIPYPYYFCNECSNKLLREAPKPFKPPIKNEEKCKMDEVNKIIPPDEFYLKMKDTELKYHDDPEECHWRLDNLMCNTLESLGYGSGIEIFLESMRWYS